MRPPQSSCLIFTLFLASTAAVAQEPYKCKVNGSMVIQDSPCKAAAPKAVPAVAPSAEASPTSQPAVSDVERQKAFLAKGAKERRLSGLQDEISRTEAGIFQLQSNMQGELAALGREKDRANNNLAGATYLNSLANEQQAVTARYQIEITTQRERLKQLQDQLVAAKREQ